MRRIILVWTLCLLATAVFAQGVDTLAAAGQMEGSFAAIADEQAIPIAKLLAYLGLPVTTPSNAQPITYKVTDERVQEAVDAYYQKETLVAVANDRCIPVKKLSELLGVDSTAKLQPLGKLGFNKADIDAAHDRFVEQIPGFSAVLTLLGMGVVFLSLMLIAFIINQLRHVASQSRPHGVAKATVETSVGKVTGPEPDVSTNAIIAVITALHLHVQEVEEKHRLMLTWRRAQKPAWRIAGIMPNREFVFLRRK